MNQSNLNIVDLQSNTELSLKKLLSLAVLNDGEKSVKINGVVIKKNEKFDFFKPDGTLCDLDLKIQFLDEVGVYNNSAKNGICVTDVTGKAAVFYDEGFANSYFIHSITDQKAFRVLRVGTVDDYLNTPRVVLSRSGDFKLFVFTQSTLSPELYYISDYSEVMFKDDGASAIQTNTNNILYSNNFFFNKGFTLQNIKLIYKKLI